MLPEMDQAFHKLQESAQAGLPMSGLEPGDATVGRTAKARREVLELIRLQEQGKHLAHPIAAVYAGLGDYKQAFHWLDVAYKARDGSLILLKTDPTLDPLRDDPRFAALLRKMKLS